MTQHITLPTAQINAHALPRDRTTLGPQAMAALQTSIATTGLRMPIEVWLMTPPDQPPEYGLISGFRRLAAHHALANLRQNGDFTSIPAFLRTPTTIPEAMALMIAENEVRADLSPWEKGRILVAANDQGVFPTIDAAIFALHPHATASQRHRLRMLASVVEAMDGTLTTPEGYSFRQLARLNAALHPDFADVIAAALQEHPDKSPTAQWQILLPILAEAETALQDPTPIQTPGRPRRLLRPRPGLTIRRERTPNGWTLHFTGPEAKGMVMDTVLDEVERMYGG